MSVMETLTLTPQRRLLQGYYEERDREGYILSAQIEAPSFISEGDWSPFAEAEYVGTGLRDRKSRFEKYEKEKLLKAWFIVPKT